MTAIHERVRPARRGIARGPLSAAVMQKLQLDDPRDARAADGAAASRGSDDLAAIAGDALAASDGVAIDDDIQLALFLLYACAYGSLDWIDPEWEWHPELLAVRRMIERAFERELRRDVVVGEAPPADAEAVAAALFDLTAPTPGPSLARYVAKRATLEQLREFVIQRSIYTLREADPHSWAIPRLTGRAKVALVEIQSDEYGGGRPERMHAEIFARTMRGLGLDARYGGYLDRVPAVTLASQNAMSMFGINRSLIGAIVGHLAAFEMTSSLPNRMYAEGVRRLGFGDDVADYFDEHVEADAVHEQIAARDLAGGLGEARPELIPDIFFGAAACLMLDDRAADHIRGAFEAGESSLRPEGDDV
ncbi:iron-containing redox enzyme family protein [Microbacterium sp.]|uniref:iron-containing redox enzyme family protein n=1 Tax=Microbacterium sp. TaxID=51671 RepID=UPI002C2605D9|nr:iron-containing redox enzyme family protein [Microbacterium sp.]HWK76677.1 iron-containing redox enzyme family protein [Microbacterium sp.]